MLLKEFIKTNTQLYQLNGRDMKNLLVLTDFSKSAAHAARYAYSLARQLRAGVTLCNVVVVPAEVPQSGLLVWPLEESDVLLRESEQALEKLKTQLQKSDEPDGVNPAIIVNSFTGVLRDLVENVSAENQIDYILMAAHGHAGLSGLMLGNHSRILIDDIGPPLFIIPPAAKITPIKKIYFAMDFIDPDQDLKFVRMLVVLAASLQAEIFITHVYKDSVNSQDAKSVQKLMLNISCENDYPLIHYKAVENVKEKQGLEWLMVHGDMDLLVMVHHPQGFFDRLIKGSLTQKLAEELTIPLLIFKKEPDSPPV